MISGSIALAEFQRFLRRRDGAALVLGLAAFGAMPVLLAGTPFAAEITYLRLEGAEMLDGLRSVTALVEILIIGVLAHVLAATSLSVEHRRGTWALLIQSSAKPAEILGGKALGVLACVMFAHVAFFLSLLSSTPVITRDLGSVVLEGLLPVAVAALAIPGGLAEAQILRRKRGYGALRSLNALQWLSPVVILAALIVRTDTGSALNVLRDVLLATLTAPLLIVVRETVPTPGLFVLIVIVSQVALASLMWRLFVANPKYA